MCAYTGYLIDCKHMGEHSCLKTAKKLKSLALMKNVINQKDTEGGFRRIKAIELHVAAQVKRIVYLCGEKQ